MQQDRTPLSSMRTWYTNRHRQNRHYTREPSNKRQCSRSSSRSPTRGRSHNRCTRRHRSPTPYHTNTITTTQHCIASNSNMEDEPSKQLSSTNVKTDLPHQYLHYLPLSLQKIQMTQPQRKA